MTIDYRPQGVCSQRMKIEIKDGRIQSLRVLGGCDGNLQGITRLVEGMAVSDAIRRLDGIHCGAKLTSCPDQLAQALTQYHGEGSPGGRGARNDLRKKAPGTGLFPSPEHAKGRGRR